MIPSDDFRYRLSDFRACLAPWSRCQEGLRSGQVCSQHFVHMCSWLRCPAHGSEGFELRGIIRDPNSV